MEHTPRARATEVIVTRYTVLRWLTASVKYLVLLILLAFILVPLYWLVVTSLKTANDVQAWPPRWIPNPISIESYREAFMLLPIARFFLNSVIIGIVMMVSNVVFCSMAGYTLTRKRFWGREALFTLVLGSMMIPVSVRLVPMYLITLRLGLVNTYAGIILPTSVTAFGVFLMRQYFKTLPAEVEDAARVDGCTSWGILFRIVMPMATPAVTSLAIFALVWSLEDFLWPLVVTSSTLMRPLQVGITLFLGLVVYEWGPVMAATAITVFPVIVIYIFLQRQFEHGLSAGAVKG